MNQNRTRSPRHRTRRLCSVLAVALLAPAASTAISTVEAGAQESGGSIVSVGGTTLKTSAPASCALDGATHDGGPRVFAERSNVQLSAPVTVDVPGKPAKLTSAAGLQRTTLGAGRVVSSFMLHADRVAGQTSTITRTGSVTFSQPVLGLQVTDPTLTAADAALGSVSTTYDKTGVRGLELAADSDWVQISADRLTVTFNAVFNTGMDEVRVITGPNAAPVAAMDALDANIADPDPFGIYPEDLTTNDVDREGEALTVKMVASSIPSTRLIAEVDGSLTYTPPTGPATEWFDYMAVDPQGATSAVTRVTIDAHPGSRADQEDDDLDSAYEIGQGEDPAAVQTREARSSAVRKGSDCSLIERSYGKMLWCWRKWKVKNDGDSSYDYYMFETWASGETKDDWGRSPRLTSMTLSVRPRNSSGMENVDWDPRSDHKGDCSSTTVGVQAAGVSVGQSFDQCEVWDVTPPYKVGNIKIKWRKRSWSSGIPAGTTRSVAAAVSVRVPQGAAVPGFRVRKDFTANCPVYQPLPYPVPAPTWEPCD